MKNNGNTFHPCLILRVWNDCWSCVVQQPAIRRSTKSRCAKCVSDIMQYETKWEHDEYPVKFGVLNLWANPFAWTGFEFAHLTKFKGYAWVWTSISVDGSFREMLQHLHTLHDIRAIRIQVTNFLHQFPPKPSIESWYLVVENISQSFMISASSAIKSTSFGVLDLGVSPFVLHKCNWRSVDVYTNTTNVHIRLRYTRHIWSIRMSRVCHKVL